MQPGQLYENQDLALTIDHRDILAEIVSQRLDNANIDDLFPGYTPSFRGRCADETHGKGKKEDGKAPD